jgi:hypothetical protein
MIWANETCFLFMLAPAPLNPSYSFSVSIVIVIATTNDSPSDRCWLFARKAVISSRHGGFDRHRIAVTGLPPPTIRYRRYLLSSSHRSRGDVATFIMLHQYRRRLLTMNAWIGRVGDGSVIFVLLPFHKAFRHVSTLLCRLYCSYVWPGKFYRGPTVGAKCSW